MKKISVFLYLTAVVLLLFSCGGDISPEGVTDGQPDEPIDSTGINDIADTLVLKEHPELSVACGDQSVQAISGTVSWNYDNGDGTGSGYCADSFHPLDRACKHNILTASDGRVTLHFGYQPDILEVRCWRSDKIGNPEAPYAAFKVENFTFEPMDGEYVYEIIGKWSKSSAFGGDARYSVIIEG